MTGEGKRHAENVIEKTIAKKQKVIQKKQNSINKPAALTTKFEAAPALKENDRDFSDRSYFVEKTGDLAKYTEPIIQIKRYISQNTPVVEASGSEETELEESESDEDKFGDFANYKESNVQTKEFISQNSFIKEASESEESRSDENGSEESESDDEDSSLCRSLLSVKVYRSLGLEKDQTIESIVRERQTQKIKQTTMEDHLKKQEKKDVHEYIAKFFYDNSIAFHVTQSESFECMLEAVGRYGRNCTPPTPYGLGTPLLNNEMKSIDVIRKRHEEAWIESGCTLMPDGWTDRRRRNIINFLVNSVAGTFYLHSIDASSQDKTTEFIADGLENAMKVIGPQHVVQICTSNASNYVRAGKLLREKYNHLFWTPCAAHVMDLILEDIGKIPQYKNCIRNAVKITNHVYNHSTLHNKWLEATKGKELVRPGVTRFATSYLTLKSLHEHSEVLRTFNWRPWVRKGDGLKVADLVVNTRFWMTVEDCLKASEPILVVLRLVDRDSKPNLSSLAAAFLKAKDAIMTNFQNIERDYIPIFKILESRWSKHYQSPLFKAAAFLNPGVYYKIRSTCGIDEVASYEEAFEDCMEKMIDDDELRMKVVMDTDLYKTRQGRFGSSIAKLAVDSAEPITWWRTFGTSTKELRRYAMRILALCASASNCERNWSLFEHIHSRKRNRLNSKRLNRLVYITYNRKLEERTQRHRLLELEASGKYDPIRVDSMNFNSEWMTGIEGAADEFVYTEADGLTWAQVEEASGAAEQPRPSTRSGQAHAFAYQKTRSSFREMGTESQFHMVMDELQENLRDPIDNIDIGARID